MSQTDPPADGDFASELDKLGQRRTVGQPKRPDIERRQALQEVLEGEEATEEFLEEFRALEDAPELSDEEIERQALQAGGEDGDAGTPE